MGANCSSFNQCCNMDRDKGDVDPAELNLVDDDQQ